MCETHTLTLLYHNRKGDISMDRIDQLLIEATEDIYQSQIYISRWTEPSTTEKFFEDVNAPKSDEIIANDADKAKGDNFIKRAIRKIKEAISALIERIKTIFLSKEEREKYEKFKEMAANNPEFANKKVTVADYRRITAMYQQALNEMDKGIAEMERSNDDDVDAIGDKVLAKADQVMTAVGKAAKNTITVDALLRMAQNNRKVAAWLTKELEKEDGYIKDLEAELGKAQAQKIKKKIKKYSKIISVHNAKLKIARLFNRDLGFIGSLEQVENDVKELTTKKTDIVSNVKRAKHVDMVDTAINSFNQNADTDITKSGIVKSGLNALGMYGKGKRFVKKTEKEAKKFFKKEQKAADKKRKEAERFLTH